MSAIPESFLNQTASLDESVLRSFPNARKVYVGGSRPDIQVPMREIALAETHTASGLEKNLPITVYDTSGPYTDPKAHINLRKGLKDIRKAWIEDRQDTELLSTCTSEYGKGRANDPELAHLRFEHIRLPRRAKAGQNVSQMHYAKKGIITPEMEFVAIRENLLRQACQDPELKKQHSGESFGANIPEEITTEFVRQEIALHPSQYQSPGTGTGHYRTKLSGQDQRQPG